MLPISKYIYLIFSLCFSVSFPAYADNWRLDKESEGIKIYTRAIQGSKVRELKGEVLLDSSLDSVLAVFTDIVQYPRWYAENTTAVLLLERNVTEHYHYQNLEMPFPLVDRDMIIYSRIIPMGNAIKIVSSSASTFCDQSPLEACKAINTSKNIRVTQQQGMHLLTPQKGGGVKLVWRQHLEPAGKVPEWLINQFIIDIPYNTLKNLQQRVRLEKYRNTKLKRSKNGKILGF